ncbi:mandelate racemase family protein [Kushneria sp. EE4]
MKIVKIDVSVVRYQTELSRDAAGHAHPGPASDSQIAMLTLEADSGARGYAFGPEEVIRPYIVEKFFKPVVIGQSCLDREKIWHDLLLWQRGSAGQLSERAMSLLDQAIWDLVGRALDVPVHRLIGGFRDRVPAYASTMCGDELEGGLSTPEDYARFAAGLVEQGYQAIKLHTWMPPVHFAPDHRIDIEACEAVRDAVGPNVALMLDGYHWYRRTEALEIGRALGRLNFAWFEEPMSEDSMESYRWLTRELDVPIIGPETVGGKFHSRASWVQHQACDILRAGVNGVGGINACLKVAHLAEAFGMDCEIHGNGAASLAVIGAISNCRWYERGLLHPFLDYNKPAAYLNSIVDPIDREGYVTVSQRPGLGEDINFDYIADNTVRSY